MGAIAVTVTGRDFIAPALVDISRTIANPADIFGTHARINIIADVIAVRVCRTRSAALVNGVKLVSVAVTVSSWNALTTTVIDGTRAIANSTSIERANAGINIIANAVIVCICSTGPTAYSERIVLISVAIAVSNRDSCSATDTADIVRCAGYIGGVVVVAGRQVSTSIAAVADSVVIHIGVNIPATTDPRLGLGRIVWTAVFAVTGAVVVGIVVYNCSATGGVGAGVATRGGVACSIVFDGNRDSVVDGHRLTECTAEDGILIAQ